ncbi:DUF551 domain-containing protein [Escherichia coli]|nr:DUF551 domain-containing protein [Escherichia coli]
MSKIDYQALREKAEKATCGVWSLEYGESRFDCDDALIHREVVGYLPICRIEGAHPESGFDEDFQMEQQANAEFIAAANPATVLELLDENERLCRELIARNGEIEGLREWAEELEAREVALPVASCIVEDGCMCVDGFSEYVGHSLPDGMHELYTAQPAPVAPDGWISCSKRTPENIPGSCKEYLVFDALNNKVHHDYWVVPDGDSAPVASFWNHYGAHVTHWMPLPEPPQEVNRG